MKEPAPIVAFGSSRKPQAAAAANLLQFIREEDCGGENQQELGASGVPHSGFPFRLDVAGSLSGRLTKPAALACGFVLALTACAETPSERAGEGFSPRRDRPQFINEPIQPIPLSLDLNERKVALGEKLFHDTRLSHDNSLACVSCHNLNLAGTDRKARSHGLDHAVTDFNAPTVFNSGFNFAQFWDGRVQTLEEQIEETTHSIIEMGSSWKEIIKKLRADPEYLRAFEEIYREGLTEEGVKDAIAEFERSLITPNSRFDQYLRGDKSAVTADELEGYALFKSYGCITCHQGVGVGGNIFETFGVLGNPFEDRRERRKADLGRFNVTEDELDRFVFKVPSLRNVAETPPYFHDGSVRNLDEAVGIMARYQLGRTLSNEEMDLIVKFLRTLSGEYKGQPLSLIESPPPNDDGMRN